MCGLRRALSPKQTSRICKSEDSACGVVLHKLEFRTWTSYKELRTVLSAPRSNGSGCAPLLVGLLTALPVRTHRSQYTANKPRAFITQITLCSNRFSANNSLLLKVSNLRTFRIRCMFHEATEHCSNLEPVSYRRSSNHEMVVNAPAVDVRRLIEWLLPQ